MDKFVLLVARIIVFGVLAILTGFAIVVFVFLMIEATTVGDYVGFIVLWLFIFGGITSVLVFIIGE